LFPTLKKFGKEKHYGGVFVMPKKLTFEEVKRFIEIESKSGCKLLSTEYENAHTPLIIRCRCGEIFKADYSHFKFNNQQQCSNCNKQKLGAYLKYKIEEIRQFVKENSECELISTEYKNAHTNLNFKCKCGNIFTTTFDSFKTEKVRQCPKCGIENRAKKKRLSFEEVKQFVKDNSECELLSTEYKNAKSLLKFRCKCGNEFETTFDSFKWGNVRYCAKCSMEIVKHLPSQTSKQKKDKLRAAHIIPINEVKELVENQMGCKYIKRYSRNQSNKYIIVFECPIHGRQEVLWNNLKRRKRCPACNEYNKQNSISIKLVENWLSEHGIDYIKEKRFEDCRDIKPMPFDFYLPQKNICIEFDGRQHFKPAYFGGVDDKKAKEHLEYIKRHDKMKNNYCLRKNIKLIRIPYFKESEIDNILKSALI
jgi:very-short-patch-repair endonuclease